jgi:cytochrome c553
MLFALDGNGTEPIAGRLIEVPESFDRHELRDPGVLYLTYVPPGSIARGRSLATSGPAGAATACATCHGPALLGVGEVPPIAGRSPSNILRQLMNFRTGARHEDGSTTMTPIVAALTVDDMVALAAYVGSLTPFAKAPPRVAPVPEGPK